MTQEPAHDHMATNDGHRQALVENFYQWHNETELRVRRLEAQVETQKRGGYPLQQES